VTLLHHAFREIAPPRPTRGRVAGRRHPPLLMSTTPRNQQPQQQQSNNQTSENQVERCQ